MVHWTNLVTQTFLNLFLVSCIEICLQILCVYFNHSIERHLEFTRMVKNMDTKSNNILWNIKTMQISMINHVKHVLFKYQPLVMKMPLDAPTIISPTSNLCFLIYVKTLLGLNAIMAFMEAIVAILLWPSVRMKLTLPKLGTWSPPGLPKTQSLIAGVKTLCIGVFLISLEKVLKCRCPKWPRMSHLDICSPSYGQKKGRKSNWQFDSRPLKVRNQPNLDMRWGNATWCWKALEERYKIGWDLVPIRGQGEKLCWPKVPEVQTGIVSGLHFGSLGTNNHLGVGTVEQRREYYMGEGGGFPEFGPWWVKWVQGRSWLVPTPKGCRMSSNQLAVGFGCMTE